VVGFGSFLSQSSGKPESSTAPTLSPQRDAYAGFFCFEGRAYAVTALRGEEEATLWPVMIRDKFDGQTFSYREKTGTSYEGIVIKCKKSEAVLTGQPLTLKRLNT
jgi:hypothetical protein